MVDLTTSRDRIDAIDDEIVRLFEERMTIAGDVAEYKIKNGCFLFLFSNESNFDRRSPPLLRHSHAHFCHVGNSLSIHDVVKA